MEDSFDFYANLPAYARFVNDELGSGLLRHFCAAVQGELDKAYAFLDNAPTFHDPDFAPREWLPWLGQWVGLGTSGDHYLGIGINPNWPEERQRRLIKEAAAYWQIKGTVPGIKKAIQLWLWEESAKSRLYFTFPFGRSPTQNPPNWWSYRTPYNVAGKLPFRQRKEFGDSTMPGTRYLPRAALLLTQACEAGTRYEKPYPEEPYRIDSDSLAASVSNQVENLHSRLGPNRPWLYFEEISDSEWNQIFPDIFELEPEIFPAVQRPTFMGVLAPEGAGGTTLKLDKVIEPVSTVRKHRLSLDGWHYYYAYQVPPRPGRTQTATVSHRESFKGSKGRTWKDFYQLPYGLSSGSRDVVETVTTEIPPVKCTPGIKTRIESGSSRTVVVSPGKPAVTRLRLAEVAPTTRSIPGKVTRGIYPGFTYKSRYVGTSRLAVTVPNYGLTETVAPTTIEPINLTGISVSTSSSATNVSNLPTISFSTPVVSSSVSQETWSLTLLTDEKGSWSLELLSNPEDTNTGWSMGLTEQITGEWSINLSAIPNLRISLPVEATWNFRSQLIDYDSPNPNVLLGKKSYYCPPQIVRPRVEQVSPGGKVIAGNTVARYNVPYFHHASYYQYFPAIPAVTQSVPEYKEIALCNVPKRWTTPKIEQVRVLTETVQAPALPLRQKYPQLAEICDSRNWSCSLFTTSGVAVIRNPTVFYWQSAGEGRKSFSFDPIAFPELYLEFVFTLPKDKKAIARSLVVGDRVIEYVTFSEILNFPRQGVYGFKFALPLEFVPVAA